MSIPDELKDGKIGRVPVWAIGVIIAGAIVLFMFLRGRSRKDAGEVTSDETVPLESVDGIPTQSFADQISGNFPQNVSLAPLPERPQTNAQWLIAAFDYLAGLGKDPSFVQRALQNYLQGKTLTDAEWQLINTATSNSALSLPPEGVVLAPLPPPYTPPPATPPPTTPPPTVTPPPASARRYVIVARFTTRNPPWNSYLQGIASRYGRSVDQLVAWNNIANRNLIYTGQKIWVDPA